MFLSFLLNVTVLRLATNGNLSLLVLSYFSLKDPQDHCKTNNSMDTRSRGPYTVNISLSLDRWIVCTWKGWCRCGWGLKTIHFSSVEVPDLKVFN